MEFAGSGNLAVCEKYFADNYTRFIKIFKDGMKNDDFKKRPVASRRITIRHNSPQLHHATHGTEYTREENKFVHEKIRYLRY